MHKCVFYDALGDWYALFFVLIRIRRRNAWGREKEKRGRERHATVTATSSTLWLCREQRSARPATRASRLKRPSAVPVRLTNTHTHTWLFSSNMLSNPHSTLAYPLLLSIVDCLSIYNLYLNNLLLFHFRFVKDLNDFWSNSKTPKLMMMWVVDRPLLWSCSWILILKVIL